MDTNVVLNKEEQYRLQLIEDLNKPRGEGVEAGLTTRLHAKQVEALHSLYSGNKKLIFVPCGRKFGKSEIAAYVLWKQALENPGSACYYIAPEASHGRKIMWDTQRFQKFLGKDSSKYLKGDPSNVEMKVKFKNGSFIQVIGSENWASANGLTPDIVVYDEFKIFHRQFHIEMDPNRAAKAAPLVVIGTMPKVGDRNKDQYEALLNYAQHNPQSCAVHTFTTFDNPINLAPDRLASIEEQIRILRDRGEEDVVQREYYSRIVPGGSRAIFPMFTPERYVRPFNEVYAEISRDLHKLEWYLMTDPGTTTCFAALLIALNPFTRKVYILTEIYETDQHMTSVRMMYPRMEAQCLRLYPKGSITDDWIKGYDEAAAWFSQEVMQQYGVYFMPTNKAATTKENGISLIKDQFIHDLVVITDECPKFIKELTEYAIDDRGKIPNRNDHAIDTFRYFNMLSNYNMQEVLEAVRAKSPLFPVVGRSPNYDDLDSDFDDWTTNIFREF